MQRNPILFLILCVVSACNPRCPDALTTNNGSIPETKKKMVPYTNGSVYQFQHSAGLIINFNCTRQSTVLWTDCDHCCDVKTKYELNQCKLTPNYPLFSFGLTMSNYDTSHYRVGINIGSSSFSVPFDTNQRANYNWVDSALVGNKTYYNVFKLKGYNGSFYPDSIYVDSLYFNFEQGILQVRMTNNEKYTRYE